MADERFQVVIGAVDEASRVLQQVKGELAGLGTATQTSQQTMSQAFGEMQRAGATLSATVTAPIVGVGAAAIKTSIDFESAFAGVRKTVDATEEEFAQLRQGILDMSNELPASANEIAKVAEAAGQLGIQTENILSFTRTMIDLGESTNLSAEQAATALARFANIVQMPQDEFDKLGSVIVDLGNNLATTEAEIVEMGLRLAGAGEQIGMTEAQIMAIAGALSSVGIRAEAGGSAFSRLMVEMQLAVETGEGSLEDFADVAGMAAEEFQQAFQEDAANAILAFIEGLSRAEERGESAIKILDDMEIKEIRLRDALLRAAGASDVFRESLEIGTEAWENNTALSEEAGRRYETTASQLEMAKNQIIELGIKLGETLLPIIKETFIPLLERLAEKLSGLVDWFNNLNPVAQHFFLAFGAAAAAGGPILLMVGSVGKAVESFKLLGSLFSGAGILGPTGLVIAGVALVAVEIIKHWDEISDFLTKCWEGIKNTASTIWGGIKSFFSNVWEGLQEYHQAYMEGVKSTLTTVWNGISSAGETIWSGMKSFFSNVWDGLNETFSSAWDKIGNTLENSWNWIKNKAGGLWDSIKGVFADETEEVNKIVEEGTQTQKSWWQRFSDDLVGHSIIPDMVLSINDWFGRIDFEIAKEGMDDLTLKWQGATDEIIVSTQKATESMNEFISVIGSIGDVVIGVQFGEKPTTGQIGGIFGGILGLFSGIPTWISGLVDMIFGWIDEIERRTQEMIDSITGQFQSAMVDFFMEPDLDTAMENFGQRLNEIVYRMMVDAIVAALIASEVVQDAAKKLGEAITEYVKTGELEGLKAGIEEYIATWQDYVIPVMVEIYPQIQQYNPYESTAPARKAFSGTIPEYQTGGYVPYTGLALLHAGEYVVPKEEVNTVSFGNIEINVNTTGGVDGADLWNEFEREARRRGVSLVQ